MKKIYPPIYFFSAIAAMAGLHFGLPVWKLIPVPWNILGVVPAVLGVALNSNATRSFRRNKTTVKPFQESATLVTGGAFRISRNPIYLGLVLILVGLAVFLGSLTPWFVVPAFAVLMDLVFIRPEQRMMEQTFQDSFRRYKKQVRR